ncbi:hypothetical protein V8G54_023566 [Vigna mungo]|uniref:ENT domain-containing protein n=1 Tax=Vigna mungo TaxID=3915 RepID=A0AAQ3N3D5_VIGMU
MIERRVTLQAAGGGRIYRAYRTKPKRRKGFLLLVARGGRDLGPGLTPDGDRWWRERASPTQKRGGEGNPILEWERPRRRTTGMPTSWPVTTTSWPATGGGTHIPGIVFPCVRGVLSATWQIIHSKPGRRRGRVEYNRYQRQNKWVLHVKFLHMKEHNRYLRQNKRVLQVKFLHMKFLAKNLAPINFLLQFNGLKFLPLSHSPFLRHIREDDIVLPRSRRQGRGSEDSVEGSRLLRFCWLRDCGEFDLGCGMIHGDEDEHIDVGSARWLSMSDLCGGADGGEWRRRLMLDEVYMIHIFTYKIKNELSDFCSINNRKSDSQKILIVKFKHIMKELQGAIIIGLAFQALLGYTGLMSLLVSGVLKAEKFTLPELESIEGTTTRSDGDRNCRNQSLRGSTTPRRVSESESESESESTRRDLIHSFIFSDSRIQPFLFFFASSLPIPIAPPDFFDLQAGYGLRTLRHRYDLWHRFIGRFLFLFGFPRLTATEIRSCFMVLARLLARPEIGGERKDTVCSLSQDPRMSLFRAFVFEWELMMIFHQPIKIEFPGEEVEEEEEEGDVLPGMEDLLMYGEIDMETQIHQLEQEAYSSVLRAFKAQADAITWEKESLITELRKELRLSNEEHRELLGRVNADDVIRRIREWRQTGGHQPGVLNTGQGLHDSVPSPTVSASRKKQKITPSVPSRSFAGPSPPFHPQTVSAPHQPSSSAAKRGSVPGSKGKKHKPGQILPGVSSMKQYPSTGPGGRTQVPNRAVTGEHAEGASFDSLVGRRVRTRWPDDNNFYEAVITNYNPADGRHNLVYDMGSANETWEWVNLSEISPEDIQWVGEDPGINHRGGFGGSGHGMNRSVGRDGVPGGGRGRGATKGQSRKDFLSSQNGIGKKAPDDIQILHTDTLIKEVVMLSPDHMKYSSSLAVSVKFPPEYSPEVLGFCIAQNSSWVNGFWVERVFSANHPDPLEIEKAKKVLKDHEQALIDAIARLNDLSDGESGTSQFLYLIAILLIFSTPDSGIADHTVAAPLNTNRGRRSFQEAAVKSNLNSHNGEGLGQRRVGMAGKRAADKPVMGLAIISHMLNQWIESDEEDPLLCTMSRGGNVVRQFWKKASKKELAKRTMAANRVLC